MFWGYRLLYTLLKREKLLDSSLKVSLLLSTCHTEARYLLTILEEKDGGDRHYAIFHSEVILLLYVILADNGFPLILLNDGSHTHARTTPCGPEVDDYGLTRSDNLMYVLIGKCHSDNS